jgi:N-formylglutamate amidohydrolase
MSFLDKIWFSNNEDDISSLTHSELLSYFDNIENFYLKDSRNVCWWEMPIDNYLVSLTHWEYILPSWYEDILIEQSDKYVRLLKNFSDFWTSYIASAMWLPEEQIIRTLFSRWIWDCNRDINDRSYIWYKRTTDFCWKSLFLDRGDLENIARKHYEDYHLSISKRLEQIEEWWKTSFLFDLHDTWVRLMDFDSSFDSIKTNLFPSISIANLDGKSCDDKVLHFFAERITFYLWFPVVCNEPYKWWYVTKYHWVESNQWKTKKRNVIQIELARFLYMKESTQEVNLERAEIIWDWLNKAIRDTIMKFS